MDRRPWLALAFACWLAAVTVNGLAWSGMELPDGIVWTLAGSVLVVFGFAMMSHPRAFTRSGGRAGRASTVIGVDPSQAAQGAHRATIALALLSAAYMAVLYLWLGGPHVTHGHLGPHDVRLFSALAATLHALAAVLVSSAIHADRAIYDDLESEDQ